MKYDIAIELLNKGVDITRNEAYVLNSIFTNLRVQEIKKIKDNGGIKKYKVSLTSGNDVVINFENVISRNMSIETNFLQNNNERIKSIFNFETYEIKFGYEIDIKGEYGYYIISSTTEDRFRFDEESPVELKFSYYDHEAEMYYKARSGNSEFLNPTIKELEYYGIVPDSCTITKCKNYHEALSIFGDSLNISNNFFEYILERTEQKNK